MTEQALCFCHSHWKRANNSQCKATLRERFEIIIVYSLFRNSKEEIMPFPRLAVWIAFKCSPFQVVPQGFSIQYVTIYLTILCPPLKLSHISNSPVTSFSQLLNFWTFVSWIAGFKSRGMDGGFSDIFSQIHHSVTPPPSPAIQISQVWCHRCPDRC